MLGLPLAAVHTGGLDKCIMACTPRLGQIPHLYCSWRIIANVSVMPGEGLWESHVHSGGGDWCFLRIILFNPPNKLWGSWNGPVLQMRTLKYRKVEWLIVFPGRWQGWDRTWWLRPRTHIFPENQACVQCPTLSGSSTSFFFVISELYRHWRGGGCSSLCVSWNVLLLVGEEGAFDLVGISKNLWEPVELPTGVRAVAAF